MGPGQFNRRAFLLAAISLAFGAGCDKPAEGESRSTKNAINTKDSHAPPRAATAEEMALIAPLAKGSSLGGWEVARVEGTDRGALRVVCVKKRAIVRLYVALASDAGPAPPATAGKYAIYYSLKDATGEEGERLANELAAVIKKNGDVPPPAGMTPFEPRPEVITL